MKEKAREMKEPKICYHYDRLIRLLFNLHWADINVCFHIVSIVAFNSKFPCTDLEDDFVPL